MSEAIRSRGVRTSLVALLAIGTFALVPRFAKASTVVEPHGGFATAYTLLYESQADLDRDLTAIVGAHARWIRFDVAWSIVESNKGTFDWTTIDRVVTQAKAHGLKLLATLAYTPGWARPAGTDDKTGPTSQAARQEYGVFAAAAAARYGKQINAWELWNEENSAAFWAPAPDPVAFAQLVHYGSAGIRSVLPDARIILGGLAACGTGGGDIDPEQFLHSLYDNGVGPDITAVGVHVTSYPYAPDDPSTAEWNVMLRIPQIHDYMASKGDGDKKVWVTEYGAPTSGAYSVTPAQQAAFVVDAYGQMAKFGDIAGPLFWYTPRDKGTDPNNPDDNYGILHNDWTQKTGYLTYATLFNGTGQIMADYLAGRPWQQDLPGGWDPGNGGAGSGKTAAQPPQAPLPPKAQPAPPTTAPAAPPVTPPASDRRRRKRP